MVYGLMESTSEAEALVSSSWPRGHGAEGRCCKRLGHVTQFVCGLSSPPAVSEAGPRDRRGLVHAVRVQGSTCACHAPSVSRVDFAGPLVTLPGGMEGCCAPSRHGIIGSWPAWDRGSPTGHPRAGNGICLSRCLCVRVEIASALVTLRGLVAGWRAASQCRRQAHVVVGDSPVPSACGDPCVRATLQLRRGSILQDPWSRNPGAGGLSCPVA